MPRPPIPQKSGDEHWKILEEGIKDILGRRQSQLKLANLFGAVNVLVNSNSSSILRTGLEDILTNHFVKWRNELSHIAGSPLIARFSMIYDDYINYCNILPKIYSLYDRRNSTTGNGETLKLIQDLFQDNVLSNSNDVVMKDTTGGIRKEIHIARSQENVELKNISNLIKMYYEFREKLDIFDKFFENLQNDTTKFYDDFFKANYEGSSFPVYLQLSSEQFEREVSIMKEILQENERNEILSSCLFSILINNEPVVTYQEELKVINGKLVDTSKERFSQKFKFGHFYNRRDIFLGGDIQENIKNLVHLLGWDDEFHKIQGNGPIE